MRPDGNPRLPAPHYGVPPEDALARARAFADDLVTRRTIRDFSDRPIPRGVLAEAVRAAASAPSGANVQPWRFVVVADPGTKRALRDAAEAEEREFYDRRASDEWLESLAPLGTDWRKPFLEAAPAIIAVFEVHRGPRSHGPTISRSRSGSRSDSPCCPAPGRAGHANPYAQPDAAPQ